MRPSRLTALAMFAAFTASLVPFACAQAFRADESTAEAGRDAPEDAGHAGHADVLESSCVPTTTLASTSGTRLKRVFLKSGQEFELLVSLRDVGLDIDCTVAKSMTGASFCRPPSIIVDEVFTDPSCTHSAFAGVAGIGPGVWSVRLGPADPCGASNVAVIELGGELVDAPGAVYRVSSSTGACEAMDLQGRHLYEHKKTSGDEALVAITTSRIAVTPMLDTVVSTSTDGARFLLGEVYDHVHEAPVTARFAGGGRYAWLPPAAGGRIGWTEPGKGGERFCGVGGGTEVLARDCRVPKGVDSMVIIGGKPVRTTSAEWAYRCSDSHFGSVWQISPTDGGIVPDAAIPIGELEPTSLIAANPSSRLTRFDDPWLASAGCALVQANLPAGRRVALRDAMRGGLRCSADVADDGLLRCLPIAPVLETQPTNDPGAVLVYTDASCTMPIALSGGGTAPTYARERNGSSGTSCSASVRTVGAEVAKPPKLYAPRVDCGSCVDVTSETRSRPKAYRVGAVVDPATFAAVTFEIR